MISSLPGNAPSTLVESRGLPSESTSSLEAKRRKLDINTSNLVLQAGLLYNLAIMTKPYYVCGESASLATSFKKCSHHDMP